MADYSLLEKSFEVEFDLVTGEEINEIWNGSNYTELKGMSINIFPIFSEKICLQMSLYLESYARLGLPRINI